MLNRIIFVMIVGVCFAMATEPLSMHLKSRHAYYDDGYYRGSSVGRFTALIISVVCGVLCFLGIMYYFKWRRETGGQFSFFDMFRGRGQQQPNPGYQQYPVQQANPHYAGGAAHYQPQQGAPGYYNNPDNPNYPPL